MDRLLSTVVPFIQQLQHQQNQQQQQQQGQIKENNQQKSIVPVDNILKNMPRTFFVSQKQKIKRIGCKNNNGHRLWNVLSLHWVCQSYESSWSNFARSLESHAFNTHTRLGWYRMTGPPLFFLSLLFTHSLSVCRRAKNIERYII